MAIINGDSTNNTLTGTASADTITGLSGNDTINAGAGNDTITAGPAALTNAALDLNWSLQGKNGASLSSGFTQDTGGVNVAVSFTNDGNNSAKYQVDTASTQYVGAQTFNPNSSLWLNGDGDADTSTTTLNFSAVAGQGFSGSVQNVTFRINDFDDGTWRDLLTITAFDANGQPVIVTLTKADGTIITTGTATATGIGNIDSSAASGSLLVTIAGPLTQIKIDYGNALNGNQLINVTDIQFQAIPVDDDLVNAGDGDDTVFGGAGNDLLNGDGNND